MVSVLNAEGTATGRGLPLAESLSNIYQRFLAIMGSRFSQAAHNVRVNLFPNLVNNKIILMLVNFFILTV
jgi:hypothetical protein